MGILFISIKLGMTQAVEQVPFFPPPVEKDRSCLIAELPDELLFEIFKHVHEVKDVIALSRVCKGFKGLNQTAVRVKYLMRILKGKFWKPADELQPSTLADYLQIANDKIRLREFQMHFSTSLRDPPENSNLEKLGGAFIKMQPVYQMQAFSQIQQALNSTNAIALKFYHLLSDPMKSKYRGGIWIANGLSVIDPEDNKYYYSEFANHILQNKIRGDIAMRATQIYLQRNGY